MFFGRVIGTVVATRKDKMLAGHRLLVVQRVNHDGQEEGEALVAVDHVQARRGDLVFMAQGKDAAWPIGKNTPVDMGIMGIVDIVDVPREPAAPESEG